MAVLLVATAGASNANAYCTEAEANTYHSMRGLNSAWVDDAGKPEREQALMWATRLLDQLPWRGIRAEQVGSLRWPRAGVSDREGYSIPYDAVPAFIKEACAEWAFYLLTEDRTLDEGGLVQFGGKVGPITDPTSYQRKSMPDSVKDMISPYLMSSSGMGRVKRA